jgi:hypothetical protein
MTTFAATSMQIFATANRVLMPGASGGHVTLIRER